MPKSSASVNCPERKYHKNHHTNSWEQQTILKVTNTITLAQPDKSKQYNSKTETHKHTLITMKKTHNKYYEIANFKNKLTGTVEFTCLYPADTVMLWHQGLFCVTGCVILRSSTCQKK